MFKENFFHSMRAADFVPVFLTESAQELLNVWCLSTLGVEAVFVSRKQWNHAYEEGGLNGDILAEGKLVLPDDIKNFELLDLVQKLSLNVGIEFDATEFSEMFVNVGRYLFEYRELLDVSVEADVSKFMKLIYDYGKGLLRDCCESLDCSLTDEEKKDVDRWLLGKIAYEKRLVRMGDEFDAGELMQMRIRLLNVFFKSLQRSGFEKMGTGVETISMGPVKKLQESVQSSLQSFLQAPKSQLYSVLFDMGRGQVVQNLSQRSSEGQLGETIYEVLGIDSQISRFASLREANDVEELSCAELDFVRKLAELIHSFEYMSGECHIFAAMDNKRFNCLGASVIGGSFLDKLGIEYRHVRLPQHSALVLITADKRRYWLDLTPSTCDFDDQLREITSDMLVDGCDWELSKAVVEWKFKDFRPYFHIRGQFEVKVCEPKDDLLLTSLHSLALSQSGELYCELFDQIVHVNQIGPRSVDSYESMHFLFYKLGDAYIKMGVVGLAEKYFQLSIQLKNDFDLVYMDLANLLFEKQDYEGALECYEMLRQLGAYKVVHFWTMAICYEKIGNLKEAARFYKLNAIDYIEDGLIEDAIKNLILSLDRYETDAVLWMLGDLYYENALRSNDLALLNKLGKFYYDQEYWDEAYYFYLQCWLINKKDPYVLYFLGNINQQKGDMELAIMNWNSAAIEAFELGKYDLCIFFAKEIIKHKNDFEMAHYFLASSYMALNQMDLAVGYFQSFLSLPSNDEGLRNNAVKSLSVLRTHLKV